MLVISNDSNNIYHTDDIVGGVMFIKIKEVIRPDNSNLG